MTYRSILFTFTKLLAASAVAGVLMSSPAHAQAKPQVSKATVLARAPAGLTVTTDDVLSMLEDLPSADRKMFMQNKESGKQLVSNLLVRRILAAETLRAGLDKQPITKAKLNIARDKVLSDVRLKQYDTSKTPTAAELETMAQNYYRDNEAKFRKPVENRVRHILLNKNGDGALKAAKELLESIRKGASFEVVAKATSQDPGSAARGGDLGFFGPGKMVKPFEDAVNALAAPGDLSEPIETEFGYHIIRLEERKGGELIPFEEVQQKLLNEAGKATLNEERLKLIERITKTMQFDADAIEAFTTQSKR